MWVQVVDSSLPTISGHKVNTGRDDHEERYKDCFLHYSGRHCYNRLWATSERTRGLCLPKHRGDRTLAYGDDSICAMSAWHGEDRAHHHSWNHRPLSRG